MSIHKQSFAPVIGVQPHTLILGSMPGEESLRRQQYYAHPRNAFWRILGELYGFDASLPYSERLEAIKLRGIALWDVLAYCERTGSLDANIRNGSANTIDEIARENPSLRRIGCNGATAYQSLRRAFPSLWDSTSLQVVQLPSSSPAAAALSYQEKLKRWQELLIF